MSPALSGVKTNDDRAYCKRKKCLSEQNGVVQPGSFFRERHGEKISINIRKSRRGTGEGRGARRGEQQPPYNWSRQIYAAGAICGSPADERGMRADAINGRLRTLPSFPYCFRHKKSQQYADSEPAPIYYSKRLLRL